MADSLQFKGLKERLSQSLFGRTNPAPQEESVAIRDGAVVATSLVPDEAVALEHQPHPVSSGSVGRLPSIERFWQELRTRELSARTQSEYRSEYRWWTKQAELVRRSVYTLRSKDIIASIETLHPATRRRKISFLRTLSQWYVEQQGNGKLHGQLAKVPSTKLPEKVPRDRGPGEFRALRARAKELCEARKREGVWIGLKLLCGCRISEIQTACNTGTGSVRVVGKGNKERVIPAPLWLLDALETIPRTDRGGWAKSRQIIARYLAKQGIRNPHSLRHTYASELLRRGKSIEEIRLLLGHSSVATTGVYAKLQTPPDVVALLENDE